MKPDNLQQPAQAVTAAALALLTELSFEDQKQVKALIERYGLLPVASVNSTLFSMCAEEGRTLEAALAELAECGEFYTEEFMALVGEIRADHSVAPGITLEMLWENLDFSALGSVLLPSAT